LCQRRPLLLANAAGRHREIAVRLALGATRRRVIRQFLTESVLLSAVGGIVGLTLAIWGVRILVALIPKETPRVEEIRLDYRVVLFTIAVVGPHWSALRFSAGSTSFETSDLNETLKQAGPQRRRHSHRDNVLRSVLVVF
jgi:ABC-type antimicrobial peptide transport system permease subunit